MLVFVSIDLCMRFLHRKKFVRSISLFLLALLAFSGPHFLFFNFDCRKEKRNLLKEVW